MWARWQQPEFYIIEHLEKENRLMIILSVSPLVTKKF